MKCTTLLAALAFSSPLCHAQDLYSLSDGRSGDIEFASITPRGHFSLATGISDKTAVKIKGRLILPPVPSGAQVPAVVVYHGSSGVQPNHYSRWAQAMVSAGYAAFVIDSFTPRGITEVATSQSRLPFAADTADAFSALRLLSTHPSIDASRIGIVGFSRGGTAALSVTMAKFRKAVLGDSDLTYAVVIAHYPGCSYSFVETSPSKTPIRMFVAEKDNYTGAAPCLALADFLKRQGYDATISIYADNNHAYDADAETANLPRVEVVSSCEPLVVNLDEPGLSPFFAKTGVRLSPSTELSVAAAKVDQWASSCMSRGARIGYNPRADVRQKAVDDTLAILRGRFAVK